MLQKIWTNFEAWLLPRSRVMLLCLVVANVGVALMLTVNQSPDVIEPEPIAALEIDTEIQLIQELPATEAQPKLPPRECRSWGPESNPESFSALTAQLDASGGFPEVRKTEVLGAPDYFVYVDGLGSRDNAKRVSRELATLQIESFVVNREDSSPILSVGVFSRKKHADRLFAKVTGLGYGVFIEEMERAQTVYNLTAHVSVGSDLHKSSTSACMAFAQNL